MVISSNINLNQFQRIDVYILAIIRRKEFEVYYQRQNDCQSYFCCNFGWKPDRELRFSRLERGDKDVSNHMLQAF